METVFRRKIGEPAWQYVIKVITVWGWAVILPATIVAFCALIFAPMFQANPQTLYPWYVLGTVAWMVWFFATNKESVRSFMNSPF